MQKAFFVDRDGILNKVIIKEGNIYSPHHWQEIETYPEMIRLKEIKAMGYKIILVTNQPDLERKLVTNEFIEEVHQKLQKVFSIDAVYCCPFASNDHPDKKPNPGMFLRAAQEHQLDLSKSFHLGDTIRDIEGAKNAGCTPILWDREYNRNISTPHRVHNFDEVIKIISINSHAP